MTPSPIIIHAQFSGSSAGLALPSPPIHQQAPLPPAQAHKGPQQQPMSAALAGDAVAYLAAASDRAIDCFRCATGTAHARVAPAQAHIRNFAAAGVMRSNLSKLELCTA